MDIYLNGLLLSLLINLMLIGYVFFGFFTTISKNLKSIEIHYNPINCTYSETKPLLRSVLFSVTLSFIIAMFLSWFYIPALIITYIQSNNKKPKKIKEIISKLSATCLPPDKVKDYWNELLLIRCISSGKIRTDGHDWSNNCEKCLNCNATRHDNHKWDGCKCTVCGEVRDEKHDWGKNCVQCAKCGEKRNDGHKWNDLKCSVCGMAQNGLNPIAKTTSSSMKTDNDISCSKFSSVEEFLKSIPIIDAVVWDSLADRTFFDHGSDLDRNYQGHIMGGRSSYESKELSIADLSTKLTGTTEDDFSTILSIRPSWPCGEIAGKSYKNNGITNYELCIIRKGEDNYVLITVRSRWTKCESKCDFCKNKCEYRKKRHVSQNQYDISGLKNGILEEYRRRQGLF